MEQFLKRPIFSQALVPSILKCSSGPKRQLKKKKIVKSKRFPLCLPEANPSSWQAGSLLLFFLTANIEKRRLTPEPSLCASQRWRILLKTNEHFSQVSWQQNEAVHAEYPHRTPCLMAWDEVSLLLLLHFLPHSKSRRESAFDQPVSLDAHKKKRKQMWKGKKFSYTDLLLKGKVSLRTA